MIRLGPYWYCGINRFWFSCCLCVCMFYWEKLFLVGLISFFNWNSFKSICVITLQDCSLCRGYSQKLLHFNQKQLEKCSVKKHQLYQPKLGVFETVDLNDTWPMSFTVRPPHILHLKNMVTSNIKTLPSNITWWSWADRFMS